MGCQTAVSSTAEKAEKTENKTEKKKEVTEDAHNHDGEEVERITIADAKKMVEAGDAIIVDARSKNSYETEHIKGSINIPAGDMEKRYKEIPKGKKIIVYCS